MPIDKGWIKLYRDIQQHWLWEQKPFSPGHAWIDLLLTANHQGRKFPIGSEIVVAERGTVVTSELKLMQRWGWSKAKVRDFLALLQHDEMLVKKSDHHKTTITLTNYCVWQDSETTEKPQKDHGETTERPQKDTNKNVKNLRIKEVNKTIGEENPSPHKNLIQYFVDKHQAVTGAKYLFEGGKDGAAVKVLLKAHDIEYLKDFIDWVFKSDDQFIRNAGYTIALLQTYLPKYIAAKAPGGKQKGSRQMTEEEAERLLGEIRKEREENR